jgi:hypothetical protein
MFRKLYFLSVVLCGVWVTSNNEEKKCFNLIYVFLCWSNDRILIFTQNEFNYTIMCVCVCVCVCVCWSFSINFEMNEYIANACMNGRAFM